MAKELPSIDDVVGKQDVPLRGEGTDAEVKETVVEKRPGTEDSPSTLEEKVVEEEEREMSVDQIFSGKIPERGDSEDNDLSEEETEVSDTEEEENTETLAANWGKNSAEIPLSATVKIKRSGKVEEIPIKELVENFRFEVPLQKKISEAEKEKQKARRSQEKVQQFYKDFNKQVVDILETSKEDPWQALEDLMILSGKDPSETFPTFIAQVEATSKQLSKMTPQQRAAAIKEGQLKAKEKRLKKREEQERLLKEQSESQAEFERYRDGLIEEYKITDEEINQAFEKIDELIKSEDEMVASGKLKAEDRRFNIDKMSQKEVFDDMVLMINAEIRGTKLINNLIEETAPSLKEKDFLASEIRKLIESGQIEEVNDIKYIIKEFSKENGTDPSQAPDKKKRKSGQSKVIQQKEDKSTSQKVESIDDIFSMDNIPLRKDA